MSKIWEQITGKKHVGNKSELKGLLKAAVDAKQNVVIINVPVELLDIDESYQIPERTARSLDYLVKNWDENKLLPLTGVPHWEVGKIFLFDGYGRWIASQFIKEPRKDLPVMVVLNAPTDPTERRIFEAKMYAFQNIGIARMTALQKRGAMLLMHDPATMTLEEMREKYEFEYVANKGNRSASIIGSYTEALDICKAGYDLADFVFRICKKAGFDRKPNGYSTYVMRALRDMYKLYPDNHADVEKVLVRYMRKVEPVFLKAEAVVKYPLLDYKIACSLFVEDIVVRELNEPHKRTVENGRVTFIVTPDDLKETTNA